MARTNIPKDGYKMDSDPSQDVNSCKNESKESTSTSDRDNITVKLIDGSVVVHGNLNINNAKVIGKSS